MRTTGRLLRQLSLFGYYRGPVAILPELPKITLDVVADRSDEREGFLTIKRRDLVVVDGTARSRPVRYDVIERRALDAAIIVAHHLGDGGEAHVYLRSAIRPPVALRPDLADGTAAPSSVLWEVPAGLIEPGESPIAGAARELEEELGFALAPERLAPLGPEAYPAPAFIGEKHFYFHVRVDPDTRSEPGGDGSPLEEAARIVSVPLARALEACRAGEVTDTKTELALRRLAEIL
jgi:ADP-ribose pyrophosphatase